MSNYSRITFKERVRIEAGISAKKSFSQIAEELGRTTKAIGAKAEELGYQKKLVKLKNNGGGSNG